MKRIPAIFAVFMLLVLFGQREGQGQLPCEGPVADGPSDAPPQMVWVDTDIGDDIDDAFALGLILRSPELKGLGISTGFGDTETRARIVDHFLSAQWNPRIAAIQVTAGRPTKTNNVMTQAAYGKHWTSRKHEDAVTALLKQIRLHPGKLTLIAIGPLFNVGQAYDRDPALFRQLCRVVMMGGSINRGYDGPNGERRPADAEWNINRDPHDAQKLFASGVPIYMLPLDSTQLHLEATERTTIFAEKSPLTNQLSQLYDLWVQNSASHWPTPTLFDPIAAAFTFRPDLCHTVEMHIEVDDQGFTRKTEGLPNAEACLKDDEDNLLLLIASRLEGRELKGFVRTGKNWTEIR